MSLLQNEDFILWQLRSSYLNSIKDGVGERLITINNNVLNNPAFRAAGWTPNPADIKRTYSPPIPTAIASEYFQGPPRSAGLPPIHIGEEEEEGGMVTGGGSNDTIGPGPVVKRRRRKEQMEEEDSSDLSDESDDDADGQRAAQQIKFAKMPVRTRAGSSPIRGSSLKPGPSVLVTSPSMRGGSTRLRSGSMGGVEAVKERARRDTNTTTSSDFSSDNELDPSVFRRKQIHPTTLPKSTNPLTQQLKEEDEDLDLNLDQDDLSGDETDRTTLSSEFAGTAGSTLLLDSVDDASAAPFGRLQSATPSSPSPKKTRTGTPLLPALPPARPVSMVQPVSLLTQALNAKNRQPASPFEAFASLSGKGDPQPLRIKVVVPFSEAKKSLEMPIRRSTSTDVGERPITVADAIGLALWRYTEEKFTPVITGEKVNVNRWVFRMVDDGEVDYDFPALDRTRPILDYASNNKRGARARSREIPFDEFALVEVSSEEQFKENELATPGLTGEPASGATPVPIQSIQEEPPPAEIQPSIQNKPQPPLPEPQAASLGAAFAGPPQRNPLMGPPFLNSGPRSNITALADAPAAPTRSNARGGAQRILQIHLNTPDGYPQIMALDVTTETYLAEVLEMICKKRQLDKAHHLLKVSGTTTLAPLDRVVGALGDRLDLDLIRRRFGHDGGLLAGSPGSSSPNAPLLLVEDRGNPKKASKSKVVGPQLLHPLAQKHDFSDLVGAGEGPTWKKFNVVRKQPMSFTPSQNRVLAIDGDYLHILPPENPNKTALFDTTSGVKTTTIHFSNVIGCKVSRRHPKTFRVIVFKERESKRYDFEASNAADAQEIVNDLKKCIEPYQELMT